jgi:site-specific recombinase XerD
MTGGPTPALVEAGRTPALTGQVLPAARAAQLTDSWLARRRSPHTRTAYARDLHARLDRCAARGVDPLRARMADVDDWIADQRLAGGRRGRPAAETTIARRVSAIAAWYRYLEANTADDPHPLVTRNPARTDARPSPDPDDSTTVGLSRAEMDRLLEEAAADSATTLALVWVLAAGGLRVGSAIAADIEDLGRDRGHRVLDVVAKRGKRRRVPLPAIVGEPIDAMLAERGHPTTGPLFLTPTGRRIYELYVYRLIRRPARRAGLPAADRLSPHWLRHIAITELLDATNGDLRRAGLRRPRRPAHHPPGPAQPRPARRLHPRRPLRTTPRGDGARTCGGRVAARVERPTAAQPSDVGPSRSRPRYPRSSCHGLGCTEWSCAECPPGGRSTGHLSSHTSANRRGRTPSSRRAATRTGPDHQDGCQHLAQTPRPTITAAPLVGAAPPTRRCQRRGQMQRRRGAPDVFRPARLRRRKVQL